ncbi:ferritin [Caldimonas brevitalea]|uniref:Ferritin n=2 Tax=Caldimonas brevitalea TaxID=413882 RepID=A0A0G3BM25_9BURK|nr:ferritin [Caldimonas brevitalea]
MERDIPWDLFDASRLSDEQAHSIKMNAIMEWAALPTTEMFLRDHRDDSDFSAFTSIWFFEQQKHAMVMMEYLLRFRPDLVPTEAELHEVRFEFDPAPALETVMLHFCGEVRLHHWYARAAEWHAEPVITAIYQTLALDEARHAAAHLRYLRQALDRRPGETQAAFTKIGALMTGDGGGSRASHPATLHVNQSLFPRDTVQSRMPDPGWLARWLDTQIRFDRACEGRVVAAILRDLSTLMGQGSASPEAWNRGEKEVAQAAD